MFGSSRKLQEAAQNSLVRLPDHFLLVQYPSAHFPGCGCCVRGPGVFRLQSSRLTMQAEKSTTNSDGLYLV